MNSLPISTQDSGKYVRAVLLNDTTVDQHHGSRAAVNSIKSLAAGSGIKIIQSFPAHQDWRQDDRILSSIKQCELILVNGEGTIHHNRYFGGVLLQAARHAKMLGIKSVLLNTTWEANGPEFYELVRNFDMIAVRERGSAQQLATNGISSRVVPDASLLHQAVNRVGHPNGYIYTDSVIGKTAFEIHREMQKHNAEMVSIFYSYRFPIDYIRSVRRFSPAVQGQLRNRWLALRAARIEMASQVPDTNLLLQRFSEKTLLVTGRFHMFMFALISNIPCLIIPSNTSKNLEVLRDVGLSPWRHLHATELSMSVLERASEWGEGEEQAIAKYVRDARTSLTRLFEDIRDLVP